MDVEGNGKVNRKIAQNVSIFMPTAFRVTVDFSCLRIINFALPYVEIRIPIDEPQEGMDFWFIHIRNRPRRSVRSCCASCLVRLISLRCEMYSIFLT